MTTLLLAHKKITATILPAFDFTRGRAEFDHLNHRGLLSGFMLAVLAAGFCGYLAALFFSFSLGLDIQNNAKAEKELAEVIQKKELLLQERINLLAAGEDSHLESMQRVLSIKYITEKSVALNQ